VHFSGIDYLVQHLITDQRVQAIGCDKVDPEIEPPGELVFLVHKCQHADGPGEFDHEVEIALIGLCFFGIRAKDPDPFDRVLFLKLVPHAPQLVQYPGSVLHMIKGRYGHFPYMSDMAGSRLSY
jgi:hypothetical protein